MSPDHRRLRLLRQTLVDRHDLVGAGCEQLQAQGAAGALLLLGQPDAGPRLWFGVALAHRPLMLL